MCRFIYFSIVIILYVTNSILNLCYKTLESSYAFPQSQLRVFMFDYDVPANLILSTDTK